jgi:hypothetical protein
LVTVGARVEPAIALAIARLADQGHRSVSREIRRALISHLEQTGKTIEERRDG